jgi:hypothetical protein
MGKPLMTGVSNDAALPEAYLRMGQLLCWLDLFSVGRKPGVQETDVPHVA